MTFVQLLELLSKRLLSIRELDRMYIVSMTMASSSLSFLLLPKMQMLLRRMNLLRLSERY
jgi:hypothetical protein